MQSVTRFIAEAKRRAVWRAMGVYIVGAATGWQLIDQLTDRIGLPEWVPGFAIVLFLIGLPIIAATAFFQAGGAARREERAYEPSDPTLLPQSDSSYLGAQSEPAPKETRHHFLLTWPRAIAGGIFAFLLLGITAGGYIGMRNAGIGPFGSLVASGALDDREPLLIADFAGTGVDSTFTQAVSQAFRVSLEQSSVISIVDASRVRNVLQRMARDPKSHLDAELAREVAERDNIKAYVSGAVTRAATSYIVSAQLVTSDGKTLASFSSTANDSTKVLDAVQKVSKKLRTKIGESLRRINNERSLEAVTTPSLEALRKYAQGMKSFEVREFERAAALLQEAVALDSTFAMAWRKLAVTEGLNGNGSKSLSAATKAYQNREHATPIERYQIEAYYYTRVMHDDRKAIETYRNLLDVQPDNYTALNNLGLALARSRQHDEAIELHQRQLDIQPAVAGGWLNLLVVLIDANRADSADKVLARLAKVEPRPSVYYTAAAYMAARRDHFDEAARAAAKADSMVHSKTTQWERIFMRVAGASEHGKLDEAVRLENGWVDYLASNGVKDQALVTMLNDAYRDVRTRRDPARALARINAALAAYPLESMDPGDRPYLPLAQLYALAGDANRARAMFADYQRFGTADASDAVNRPLAEGLIAMASGNHAAAHAALVKAASMESCASCYETFVGLGFEAANQPDSAIARYEHYIATPGAFRFSEDAFVLAPTHERLAELYDARGDRANAARHAAAFVELWKGADAELQGRVAAKRAMLQRLARE